MSQVVQPWLQTLAALLVACCGALGVIHHASANQPNDGIEFTLHIGDCSTDGDQKANCSLSQGQTFVVSVSLDDMSGLPNGTIAIWVALEYIGVHSKDNPVFLWPVCLFPTSGWLPGYIYANCANFSEDVATFTGTLYTSSFNCLGDGTISLRHDETGAYDSSKENDVSEAGPDVLNIDCAPPTPTPTPTPTPDAVGGVAFDAGSSSQSGFAVAPWFFRGAGAVGLTILGCAAWRLRRAA